MMNDASAATTCSYRCAQHLFSNAIIWPLKQFTLIRRCCRLQFRIFHGLHSTLYSLHSHRINARTERCHFPWHFPFILNSLSKRRASIIRTTICTKIVSILMIGANAARFGEWIATSCIPLYSELLSHEIHSIFSQPTEARTQATYSSQFIN